MAGCSFPIDRKFLAEKLGFSEITHNSLDAVSDRDYILDFLFSASTTLVHLSRLAEDLIIFSTPEFGWKGVGDCELTGITRNPWNLDKTPGGSSGGASAALAARMGPLAIGGDGGGSIRIPASLTGVFGIKANYGRVPMYPEGPMRNLTHGGPMTLTVEDAALLLTAISEPDYRDWTRLVLSLIHI